MSPRAKAALFLALAPPILTEVTSGNTPVHEFLTLKTGIFLVLAYSFPVLIIRETALRRKLSPAGIFFLGLAYGILNEGLLAQTLIRLDHVPIDKFDHYIYVAGFNLSWTSLIVPWHAIFAVLFPLALLDTWFSAAPGPWLAKRSYAIAAFLLLGLVVFISLVRTPHPQMLVCLLSMVVLAAIGFRCTLHDISAPPLVRGRRNFFFGLLAYPALFLGTILLAARRTSPPLFFLLVLGGFAAAARIGSRRGLFRPIANPHFALGAYAAVALFLVLIGVQGHSTERALTGCVLAISFLVLAFRSIAMPPGGGVFSNCAGIR